MMDGCGTSSIRKRLHRRFGEHSALVMMLVTPLGGAAGGLLVLHFVERTLDMPDELRRQFRWTGIFAVGLTVLLTLLLTRWETRRLLRMLRNALVAAMDAAGRGNVSQRLRPTGNDEVDILARQFNAMLGQLEGDHRTIRELNGTLEEKVRLRTTQMEATVSRLKETQQQLTDYNRQLETAREDAETANRAKGDFLANISHELRTPLNGVLGMTELLLETPLDDQQRRFAQTVKNSGQSLLRLLNDVIDYSKVEAGKLDIENIDFNLRETVEPVVEAASFRCVEKPLEIAFYLDPSIPETLIGDPGRLRQVLANLVNNAVKFTEEGSVVVRIERKDETNGRHVLEFSVRDTGIGIPRDRFDRLFQSFSQVDASTTRKYGGSGLGLAICRQLCDLMNGEISFDSREGVGSTFRFTLPLQIPRTCPNRPCSDTFTENWSQQWIHANVLVIDDNGPSRETLAEQLSSWGFQVEQAGTLHAGLQCLRDAADAQQGFQLVFVDSSLDGLHPRDFAEQVHSLFAVESCRLLIMYPLGKAVKWSGVLANGYSHFLTKPVLLSTLFDAVANLTAASVPLHAGRTDRLPQRRRRKRGRRLKSRFAGARILLAEDNDINQDVAGEVLARAGFDVVLAENGRQTLDTVSSQPIDLVLMDCQMPEMDGFAAAMALREQERREESPYRGTLPIIALTAMAQVGERERCLDAGMNDYLTKPLKPRRLIAAIEAALTESDVFHPTQSRGDSPLGDDSPLPSPELDVPSILLVLNYDELLERCLDDDAMARRLLQKFDARIDVGLSEISHALKDGDGPRAAQLAHALKGSSANLSAESLQSVAAELEVLARSGDLVAAGAVFPRLQGEVNRLRRDIAVVTASVSLSETMVLPLETSKVT